MKDEQDNLTPEQEEALVAVVERELDERKLHGLECGAMGEFLFEFGLRVLAGVPRDEEQA